MNDTQERAPKAGESGFDLGNPIVLLAWQRNHLANERTFLAWMRTGLALFAFSFVLERFDFFLRRLPMISGGAFATQGHFHTKTVSLLVFMAGVVVTILAGWRFFAVRKTLNSGETGFSATPDLVFLILVAGLICGMSALFWLLLST